MTQPHHFRNSARPQIAVKVEIISQSSSLRFETITKDVGTGGVFLVDDNGLQNGQKVEVVLSTPSTWNPLSLKAEVVWVRPNIGVGLQFEDLSEVQLLALANFVSTLDYKT